MEPRTGLRDRKKQQTRQLIFETAARLFAARGFDVVTVAEVARAADVSEMTVFNYFPTRPWPSSAAARQVRVFGDQRRGLLSRLRSHHRRARPPARTACPGGL